MRRSLARRRTHFVWSFFRRRLAAVKERGAQNTTWERTEMQDVQMRTATKIFEGLGGRTDPSVAEGVFKAISKCVAMGPPWVHRHPQTDLVEYAVISVGWRERFTTAWSKFREEVDTTSEAVEHHEPLAEKVAASSNQRAAAQVTKMPPPATTPKNVQAATNEITDVAQRALKAKAKFLSSMSAAVQVVQAIESDEAWGWANNQNKERLQRQIEIVQAMLGTQLVRLFILQEWKDIRKNYGDDYVARELAAFIGGAGKIDELAAMTVRLNKAHATITAGA